MIEQTKRWRDWPAALFLLGTVGILSLRFRATEWTDNLARVETLAYIAAIFGLALGASAFSGRTVRWFALVFTLFFIPMELGLMLDYRLEWTERLLSIAYRLYSNISEVSQNRPISDSMLFLFNVSLIFWLIGLIAGYGLTRNGKPWTGLILAGVALLVVDHYSSGVINRERYTAVFFFLVLLLIARINYLRSRRAWVDQGMGIDPEVGFDMGRTVIVAGLVLVLLAWNTPTFIKAFTPGTEIRAQIERSWQSLRDRLSNVTAGLRSPSAAAVDSVSSEISLGVGGILGDDVVFTVETSTARPNLVRRYYWRARSYDLYDAKGQWRSSAPVTGKLVAPGEWPNVPKDLIGRKLMTFTINPSLNFMRNLYIPAYTVGSNRKVEVLGEVNAEGLVDVAGVIAEPPLRFGEVYRVQSYVNGASEQQLKAAGTDFPAWVTGRYLQLPNNFSRRISTLARTITAGKATQYEKVIAITEYLRNNITYVDTIPSPPSGRDPIEWFLLDYRKGFCNYYATAEVLMLRSLGIPARLSVGFAEGESELGINKYTVRRRDSHAWPEVYFNGIGWVEFEPTVAQIGVAYLDETKIDPEAVLPDPAIKTPDALNEPDRSELFDPEVVGITTPTVSPVVRLGLMIGLGILTLTALWFFLMGKPVAFSMALLPVAITSALAERGLHAPDWVRVWSTNTDLTPMERLFSRVNWMLTALGKKPWPGMTPAERIQMLSSALPEAQPLAETLLAEYHRAEYSPHMPDYHLAQQTSLQLWGLVSKAFLKRLVGS